MTTAQIFDQEYQEIQTKYASDRKQLANALLLMEMTIKDYLTWLNAEDTAYYD